MTPDDMHRRAEGEQIRDMWTAEKVYRAKVRHLFLTIVLSVIEIFCAIFFAIAVWADIPEPTRRTDMLCGADFPAC